MADIPDELLELWSRRDRKFREEEESDDGVLIAYKSGDDPDELAISEPVRRTESPPPKPLLPPSVPVPVVPLYPTYKIAPQPINLATYDVRKPRK